MTDTDINSGFLFKIDDSWYSKSIHDAAEMCDGDVDCAAVWDSIGDGQLFWFVETAGLAYLQEDGDGVIYIKGNYF